MRTGTLSPAVQRIWDHRTFIMRATECHYLPSMSHGLSSTPCEKITIDVMAVCVLLVLRVGRPSC
jgi:hypothetical protein